MISVSFVMLNIRRESTLPRIIVNSEFQKFSVGCTLVANNSWPTAPTTTPILGLKELPVSNEPLPHTHIQFAHCFKQQAGWSSVLTRFHRGGGTLYDVEFLTDANGRRVAAFGFHAGVGGAAAGVLAYIAQKRGKELGKLEPFNSENEMVSHVNTNLDAAQSDLKVLVMGALGRCGRGAVSFFRKIGVKELFLLFSHLCAAVDLSSKSRDNILKWDLEETKSGGPFDEILDVDVFVNCIYLSSPIPPFIALDQIRAAGKKRRLSVVVDVSCDATNPHNPIPIYKNTTTFSEPTLFVDLPLSHSPAVLNDH
jgi:saccharopine dehydrogenase (NAD+, L-lysine-forming)